MTGDSPLTVIVSATGAIFSVHRQLDALADRDDDTLADDGGEAGQDGGDFVRAGREIQEPELAAGFGDERLRGVDALRRDRDAGQHAALFVLDGAADAAALNLRERGHREREKQSEHRSSIVSSVLFLRK